MSRNIIQPEGNYFNKFEDSNPIIKKIMSGYFTALKTIISHITFDTIIDAGCGEGYVSNFLYQLTKKNMHAFDVSESVIKLAQAIYPQISFATASIYNSRFENNSFDLVTCLEVLEHLDYPEKALKELCRISQKYLILSVPNEPIWRISNFVRGKYLKDFGNTPGHVNHWGQKAFLSLCQKYGNIVKIEKPFPWIMVLMESNRN